MNKTLNTTKRTLAKLGSFLYAYIVAEIFIAIFLIFGYSLYNYKLKRQIKREFNTERNINMQIVSFNSECSLDNTEFKRPQLCNAILFRTINEPYLYREINTCRDINWKSKIHIDTKWLYNHRVGDTIHFDFLLKYKFFTIDR